MGEIGWFSIAILNLGYQKSVNTVGQRLRLNNKIQNGDNDWQR
jgi:hypothetical protein